MENKNEMTPQELLAKLKESIKNDPAPANEADKAQEISEISDDEIIRSYEEAQKEESAPSVVYHFSVRRKQAESVKDESSSQEEQADEPEDVDIPASDIEINTPAFEASAPVDVMKEFMSDAEIADMQRFAAMPNADEIAQKAKELSSSEKDEADEGDESLPLSDEIVPDDAVTVESGNESEEIKMNITPDEASKRNAMDFISSLTKKAATVAVGAENAADAAVDTEKAMGAAAGAQNLAEKAVDGAAEQSVDEFDDVDVNLMIAFGMEDRLKETVGAEEARKIKKQVDNDAKNFTNTDVFKSVSEEEKPVEEFTDNSQIKTIFAAYKTRYRKLIMKIGASAAITLFLFFFENLSFIGVKLPGALNPGFYPIVNIMVGLQMLVLSCALVWDGIKRSVNALLAKKPTPECATALMLVFALIYQLLTLIFSRDSINTFNLPVSFAVLVTLIGEFLSLKREIFSFNIAASKKVKYTLEAVPEGDCAEERETFSYFFGDDLKDEDSDMPEDEIPEEEEHGDIAEEASESENNESRPVYKMKKGAFIDGFFERMNRYPSYKAVLGFIIPVFAIISVLFFILGFVRTGDISGAIRMGYIALVMCTPAAMFISFDYPAYKASKNAFENESAIIGEAAAQEYLDAAIMTFEDKDIFPSRGVKVKSIKVYGSHRIDRVVFNAANIFRKYGGPLSSVFNKATLELGTTDEVFFGTVEDDGIEAMVSGSHIYLGTTDYLRRKGYEPVIDDEDEVVEGNGGICIMFMAIEDEIAAKFYVEYTIDAEFEHILRALYSSGICIAVRSYDPNISDRMLNLLLRYEQYPVKVIKTRSDENVNIAKEHAQSGVVSRRSVKDMLRAFMSCDKVLRAIKSATALKIASMAVALAVLFIILIFGAGAGVASVYAVLYQLFWMIPLFIIVRFLI